MTRSQHPTTTDQDSVEAFAAALPGRTVHALRGTRYAGLYQVAEVLQVVDGWIQFQTPATGPSGAGAAITSARPEDLFDTEADARQAARARRKPRTPRKPRPLYGDLAAVAAINGISTDGTGRYLGRNPR